VQAGDCPGDQRQQGDASDGGPLDPRAVMTGSDIVATRAEELIAQRVEVSEVMLAHRIS
jgi:hypothetical protein